MRKRREGASGDYGGVGVGMIRWGLYVGKGWLIQWVGVGCDGVRVGLS
jgi:hypothetical protein